MKKLLLLLVIPAVLAGCSSGPEVKSGVVVEKTFSPESGYYQYECFAYDSKGQCTMDMPIWEDIPASWSITLRNCQLKEKDSDPCPTEDWDVSQSEYNSIRVGQHLTIKDN